MGGIADYSGSLVLQMPIREETRCRIETLIERKIEVVSADRPAPVSLALDRIMPGGDLGSYESARSYFSAVPERHWASYVVGVLLVLILEAEIVPSSGLSIAIESDVPEGKGVSSSAALEVATMRAFLALAGAELEPVRVAEFCQTAENLVTGAPCGIMDQMTATCGQRGRLMKLLCQPAELQGYTDLPEGTGVWGIDSGVRHAVTGSDYSSVRAAAFMGMRVIEKVAGPEEAARFGGYLANIEPVEFRKRFASKVPERMSGRDFLDRYGGISDDVVRVDPASTYRVRAATSHPIQEHDRIRRFARLLEQEPTEKNLAMAGELMYLSHAGYSACGLGSRGTDRIVEMVREEGYKRGLYGARITGGGSGGTVAVLARSDASELIKDIADRYEDETGRYAQIFW